MIFDLKDPCAPASPRSSFNRGDAEDAEGMKVEKLSLMPARDQIRGYLRSLLDPTMPRLCRCVCFSPSLSASPRPPLVAPPSTAAHCWRPLVPSSPRLRVMCSPRPRVMHSPVCL